MGRFAVCPYYMSDKRLSISCEDTVRQFWSKEEKREQMRTYCEKNWCDCPYAIDLNDMYERMDDMKNQKDRDVAALEHLAAARKKENEMLRQRMGYINARNQSLEMMLGYLCDKFGVTEVDLDEVAGFFGMYTVNWKETDEHKLKICKVKKNGH